MLEDIQLMCCCLDMAKHIYLAIVVFLESLADGRARRLGMARTAAVLRICGGHSASGWPGQPRAPPAHRM